MSSYVVLARKWRPAQFSDIVGQGHIVRTFMNAIRTGRIHQAYLFTGSRGIGKTSIARIFSKAIRCENTKWDGTWLRSCDECPSCKEVAAGNSVDVIEIDGASNNGVDAIRDIRENAKYLPSTGSRKIYIIDEVHMLTTAAFNALLKTLEEPPAHVIFVFATTEPHKIPATILSRCQRFDFRRVTLAQIQMRLAEVTQAEGIAAEPAALSLIARAAEGSMRDALSLLDQVIAFSGAQITAQSARESIGLIEGQTVLGILAGILGRNPAEALQGVEQAYEQGHDLRVLTRSLIEALHAAVLAKIGVANPKTLELSEEEWKRLQDFAAMRSLEEIELIFQVLNHGIDWIARSPQPKIILDVLLVKCATAEALARVADTGTAGGSGSSSEAPQKSAPAARPVQAVSGGARMSEAPVRATAPAPVAAPVAPASPAMAAAPAPASTAHATPNVNASWEGLIDKVRETRPLLASILEHGICSTFPKGDAHELLICFKEEDAYYRDQLQTRLYNEQLANISKDYVGKHVHVRVELGDVGESLAEKKARESEEKRRVAREAAQNHPIIREAQALFGGELGPIELIDSAQGSGHAV